MQDKRDVGQNFDRCIIWGIIAHVQLHTSVYHIFIGAMGEDMADEIQSN